MRLVWDFPVQSLRSITNHDTLGEGSAFTASAWMFPCHRARDCISRLFAEVSPFTKVKALSEHRRMFSMVSVDPRGKAPLSQ